MNEPIEVLNYGVWGWYIMKVYKRDIMHPLNTIYPCLGYVNGSSVYSIDMLDLNFDIEGNFRRLNWEWMRTTIESLKNLRLEHHLKRCTSDGTAAVYLAL